MVSIEANNRILDDENGTHAILWNTSNSTLRYNGSTMFDWKNLAMPPLGNQGTGVIAVNNSGDLSWQPTSTITYQRIIPIENGSYSIPNGNSVYLNLAPNGSLATYSIYLPPNPIDGEVVYILASDANIYDWNISSLFILPSPGQAVDNAVMTSFTWPNRNCSLMWSTIDGTWIVSSSSGGGPGPQGWQGVSGAQGSQGPIGTIQPPDYFQGTLNNTGLSSSYALNLYQDYSVNIGLSGSSQIILNPDNLYNKTYMVSVSFYIYNNGAEQYVFRFKLNGTVIALDLNLDIANDVSPKSSSFIININSTSILEFWKLEDTISTFNTLGNISIFEIAGSGPQGIVGPTGPQGPAGSGAGNVVFLTYETDNNTTISSTASMVFLSSDYYLDMSLTLPNPQPGWQMTLIRIDNYYSENTITINGTFFDGSSNYDMNYSGSNIVIVYDGSAWHILSTNTSD